jgi:hypothetical protein
MRVYAEPLRIYCLGTPDRALAEPADLVQGFFADRLARDDYFQGWKESGLRLRRWLMNGFGFYLKERRRERRKLGRERSLDEGAEPTGAEGVQAVEAAMDRAFAASVVKEALVETRRACEAKGQSLHWQIFHRHYYEGRPYAEFIGEHGLTPARAAEMARTAAAKFKAALRELIAGDGALESEIDAEIATLLEVCG